MSAEKMNYKLHLLFEVNLAKWRIDDQRDPNNQEWCLMVYDRNKQEWISVNACDRPGEGAKLLTINIAEE